MNHSREITKHKLIKQHRKAWYERSLDRLMNGQAQPEEVKLRWEKLKQVK